GGSVVGLAVGRARRRGPLAEFTLADVLVPPGDRAAARALLRAVRRRCGCDHVATHLPACSTVRSAALRAGYAVVPRTGMSLVARPYGPLDPDPLTLASWRFALGDL